MLGHGRSLNLVWLLFGSDLGAWACDQRAAAASVTFEVAWGVAPVVLAGPSMARGPVAPVAAAVGGAAAGALAVGADSAPAGAAACFCCAAFAVSHDWNSSFERASTTIGMKRWSRPQSSAHCPRKSPGLSASMVYHASFTKPGMPSFLTPKAGTHQEWMTSAPVTSRRTLVPT